MAETYSKALLKTSLPIIPKLIHERHVLIQLLLRLRRHTRARQSTFILLLAQLHELGSLTGFRFQFLERVHYISPGVIGRCSIDLLPKNLLSMGEYPLDEFACVVSYVEERDGSVPRRRHGKSPVIFWGRGTEHLTWKIGHVEAREEECGWDVLFADVLFHVGFGVEVLDVGVFAVAEFVDIQERRPDEVLDTAFLMTCQYRSLSHAVDM